MISKETSVSGTVIGRKIGTSGFSWDSGSRPLMNGAQEVQGPPSLETSPWCRQANSPWGHGDPAQRLCAVSLQVCHLSLGESTPPSFKPVTTGFGARSVPSS